MDVSLDYRNVKREASKINVSISVNQQKTVFNTVSFQIRIKLDSGELINIEKRYSELEELYCQMQKKIDYLMLPGFPKKDIFMKVFSDENKLGERKQDIIRFLEKLLTNSLISHTNFLILIQKEPGEMKTSTFEKLKSHKDDLIGNIDKLKKSNRDWLNWFDYFKKLDNLHKVNKNFTNLVKRQKKIKSCFLNIQKTVKNEKFFGSSELLGVNTEIFNQGCDKLQKQSESIENDIQSFKTSLERYIYSIKKRFFNEDKGEFFRKFEDENLFSSLENSKQVPSATKKELKLIKKQLDLIIRGIEDDFKCLFNELNFLYLN